MKNYKDKIMECLTIAVVYADDYPPLRDTCLIGIFELILTPNFLEPQETQQYVVQIYQAMMEDSNERNRDNARGLMKDLAGRQTGLVRKECIEPLLSIGMGVYF